MDWFNPVFLSRLQFALTAMFHYLFPPLSIGLGVLLVFMEGMYLKTRQPIYEAMTKFWVKIFGLVFGLGVASGIVMEFEFGMNWATYSRFVGDVFGSALAAEGIFAFFLESGFLAILLFGWDKVSARMHFVSTCMVSLGSIFSAIWIVVANSWQQTPAGFHIVGEGLMQRAEIVDFWAMVFNPSSVVRLAHTVTGAFILGGFFVMSVTAYYLLKGRHQEFARRGLTIALIFAAVTSVVQFVLGDWHGKVVARTQPAKLAAFEGVYETRESTPLYLLGFPDDGEQRVRFGLGVPGLLSFVVHGDFRTPVKGFDQIPPDERPPVALTFQSYHLMVALGFYAIALTLLGVWFLWRGTLFEKRWLLWLFVFSVAAPYVANQAGWVAAEVGRQPWIVYGLLRTQDAVSKAVTAGQVAGSLVLFGVIYLMLFALFVYLLDRKIKAGPESPESIHPPEHPRAGDVVEAAGRRGKSQFVQTDGDGAEAI
ncbi:MAG: cytochrome ubiquinol oxidase subunit I [Candidatus Sumerlaeia bacterium]